MIVLVNTFRLHGTSEDFERVFADVSECMRMQSGFLRHRLLGPAYAGAAYVNIAEWRDEQSLRDALARPAVVTRLRPLAALATGRPALYRPVPDRTSLEA